MTHTLTRRSLGAAILATALLTNFSLAKASDYANPDLLMSVDHLKTVLDSGIETGSLSQSQTDVLVIDVRPAEEFDQGHIPGALQLDPNAVVADSSPVNGALLPQAELVSLLGSIGASADKKLVLYDDKQGFHAARLFWLLEYLGHQKVTLLNGGLSAWVSAGGALSTEATQQEPAEFMPAPMPRRLSSADYILRNENDLDTIVIDVRPTNLFEEGHIPWAVSIPWKGNLTADGTFKSAAELTAHFSEHDVTADRNIVIHCQIGLASSHSYVALRLLGYPKVRVYHRSWAEWGNSDDLPRATGS